MRLLFSRDHLVKNLIGLGIYSPPWQRASFPNIHGTGRFEYETFDPRLWMPNFNLAPLANALPDDKYWAAKQVMAFTDDDIRALVKSGEYSDPRAVEWLSECLDQATRQNREGILLRCSPAGRIQNRGWPADVQALGRSLRLRARAFLYDSVDYVQQLHGRKSAADGPERTARARSRQRMLPRGPISQPGCRGASTPRALTCSSARKHQP